MHEAFKIFVLSTLVINLWTVFILLQDKRGNKLLNRWFAAFLVALALPQMDLYANQIAPGGVFTLAVIASSFLWLKGPFICIFINVLSRKPISIRNTVSHFVPWLCALTTLFIVPEKIMTYVLLGMCHMLSYLLFSLWRLVKMRPFLSDLWHEFPNSAYYWLLYIIVGVMGLAAVDFVVMSLVMSGVLQTYQLLDYFAFPIFSVYALSIGILSVYRPELLFREHPARIEANKSIATTNQDEQIVNASTEADAEPKERHLELDSSLAQNLSQQLTRLMEERNIYRQNELSLADLASHLGISTNQASELLNVHAGLSFYHYVNGYRLKYACDLLSNPKCHLRILDIAFEAGYNNKNSFYKAFKDSLGVTPNQFRAKFIKDEKSSKVAETN